MLILIPTIVLSAFGTIGFRGILNVVQGTKRLVWNNSWHGLLLIAGQIAGSPVMKTHGIL
jgi:hypothetical protein